MSLYFDYAAATPVDQDVQGVMQPYLSEYFYNPSSLYDPARKVKQALQTARGQVAEVLGAKPIEIIFTAGATESINLAIGGVLKQHSGKVVISAIEHEAVLDTAALFAAEVKVCPVGQNGLLELDQLAGLIDDSTVIVSVMYANNEIGTIQPLKRVSELIKQIRTARKQAGNSTPIYLHTDASQAANYLDLHVSRLGVDLLTLNGGKIYGPKHTGCLYVRTGVDIAAILGGGGQERGLRGGTENVAGAVGFACALQKAASLKATESNRIRDLQQILFEQLPQLIPGVTINGDLQKRLPNNVNISIPGVNGETLVHHLDSAGILVATGSACNASKDKPSHVLLAIGLDEAMVSGSLRITLGRGTTEDAVATLLETLPKVVASLKN